MKLKKYLCLRRQCIYEMREENISYRKIGEVWNISPERVRQIYFKTIRNMEKQLKIILFRMNKL